MGIGSLQEKQKNGLESGLQTGIESIKVGAKKRGWSLGLEQEKGRKKG